VKDKTKKIQIGDGQILLRRKDNTSKNILIIDKDNIYANSLQVINQYENNSGTHKNRYDVTILVNGIPMVHIELKKRGISLKEAFNQIERYQKESF
jgi:type I restriction enzyme R subunit